MKIAVLGGTGLLGMDLAKFLTSENVPFARIGRASVNDQTLLNELRGILSEFDYVVNCIGSTNVDEIETEPSEALRINAHFVNNLATAISGTKTHLIHISSNFVFNGEKNSPYLTSDIPSPINSYGLSKALAEEMLSKSDCKYTIVRTGWLYGSTSTDFPKLVASQLVMGKMFLAATDQFGQPTWTRDLSEFILRIALEGSSEKIVHGVSSGKANKYELAREVESFLGIHSGDLVKPSLSAAFSTRARRPVNSTLEASQIGNFLIGDWRERWRQAASEVLGEFN